jgi:hypothetical protein
MKQLEAAHRARPWRVHTIAHDFALEDLWTIELGDRKPKDVREFLTCFWSVFEVLSDSKLAKARLRIGEALKWDDHDLTLPIPGCSETTVSERLSADDLANDLSAVDAPSLPTSPKVKAVYVFADEALYEFSNDTIHGLLHVSLGGDRATLGVYVKMRGVFSRVYMAAIWPARHLVVYPALIRKLEDAWRSARVQ